MNTKSKAKVFVFGAAFLAFIIGASLESAAQILTPHEEFEKTLRPPLDVQGQLFSIRTTPAAGESQVLITGVPVEELEASDEGLRTRVQVGEDIVPRAPASIGDGTEEIQIDVNEEGEAATSETK